MSRLAIRSIYVSINLAIYVYVYVYIYIIYISPMECDRAGSRTGTDVTKDWGWAPNH